MVCINYLIQVDDNSAVFFIFDAYFDVDSRGDDMEFIGEFFGSGFKLDRLSSLIFAMCGVIVAMVTVVLRKQYNEAKIKREAAEKNKISIVATLSIAEFHKTVAESLHARFDELTNNFDELHKDNLVSLSRINELEMNEKVLKTRMSELTTRNDMLTRRMETLCKENVDLRSRLNQVLTEE